LSFFFLLNNLDSTTSFSITSSSRAASKSYTQLHSTTPFDASLYDNDDDDDLIIDTSANPFAPPSSEKSLLAVDPDTPLLLGINKYSHDTSICAAHATTGEVLFAFSKERISRKKHVGGNVASLVESCLSSLELDLDNVKKVVCNNHHHRIIFEESSIPKMEWEEGLGINGGAEIGYTDDENTFLNCDIQKVEMSHHLAHAYSAAAQCPFESGMIVIMDGMGETYRSMKIGSQKNKEDVEYVSDLDFEGEYECIPSDIAEKAKESYFDWREGESVYVFDKSDGRLSVKPIFKRFTEENTPPTLYNHGFENMDSVGAIYSRASSHIFGDWNACGKVMGLAPWMGHAWTQTISDDEEEEDGGVEKEITLTAEKLKKPIIWGKLYKEDEEAFGVDRSSMMGMPHIARNDPDLFDDMGNMVRKGRYDFDDNVEEDDNTDDTEQDTTAMTEEEIQEGAALDITTMEKKKHLPTKVALDAISLSSRVQDDLESIVMDFVQHFKEKTGETNLCLAGGVALNSVLNGRLSRELGFEKVFIPPYPGDDGIAVGCCAYGLFGNKALDEKEGKEKDDYPQLWSEPLSPYLGPMPSKMEIREAIEAASPWLQIDPIKDDDRRFEIMAREIESGGVIAWYHSRSELGPRALGHRSILADPRKKALVRFINEHVKKRESFRPFAPSCLAEEASNWFDLGDNDFNDNVSPYMSITANVKESKRGQIPAVTHVDGSSRLQTVTAKAEPLYHRLISAFFDLTGVPMVLNTSFNTLKGEPIVETPSNAIRSFLSSMGSIEMLVMDEYVIRRRDCDMKSLMGEERDDGLIREQSKPKRAGDVFYETKFTITDDPESIQPVTRVCIPDRPMHNEKDGGWFELLDDLEGELLGICDGSSTLNEILTQFKSEMGGDGMPSSNEDDESTELPELDQILFENIMRRLIRLYEHTLISW